MSLDVRAAKNAGRIEALMHAIAPGLIERIFAKQVEKNHFQDKPVPESPGNLFNPMEEYESVSVGSRKESRSG